MNRNTEASLSYEVVFTGNVFITLQFKVARFNALSPNSILKWYSSTCKSQFSLTRTLYIFILKCPLPQWDRRMLGTLIDIGGFVISFAYSYKLKSLDASDGQ